MELRGVKCRGTGRGEDGGGSIRVPKEEEPRAGCYLIRMASLQLPPTPPHGAKAPEQGNGRCNQPWGLHAPPVSPPLPKEGPELPHSLT